MASSVKGCFFLISSILRHEVHPLLQTLSCLWHLHILYLSSNLLLWQNLRPLSLLPNISLVKWLLSAKGCNLSHARRPVAAFLSGSSARQAVNQSVALQEPLQLSCASQHFTLNNFPAGTLVCRSFDGFVHPSQRLKMHLNVFWQHARLQLITLSARLKCSWRSFVAASKEKLFQHSPKKWAVMRVCYRFQKKCQSAFWTGCRCQEWQKLTSREWQHILLQIVIWAENRRTEMWSQIPLLPDDGEYGSIVQWRICWLGPRLRQVDDLCVKKSFYFQNPWLIWDLGKLYNLPLSFKTSLDKREGGCGSWQSKGCFWQGETSEPHLISTFVPKSSWAAVRGGPAAGDYQSQGRAEETQLS